MVSTGLGAASVSQCDLGDGNDNDRISIGEIITALNHALNGRGGG